jgi:hypothetical protein
MTMRNSHLAIKTLHLSIAIAIMMPSVPVHAALPASTSEKTVASPPVEEIVVERPGSAGPAFLPTIYRPMRLYAPDPSPESHLDELGMGARETAIRELDALWTQVPADSSFISRERSGRAALVPDFSAVAPASYLELEELASAWETGKDDISALLLPPTDFLVRPVQSPTSTVVITQNTTWYSDTVVGTLVVTNSATLTLTGAIAITAANVTVAEGAFISADGQGYGGDSGPGTGASAGSGGGSGGAGHGGWGGSSTGSGGTPYGDVYAPLSLGSGGASRGVPGGAGGGSIAS